MKLTNLPLSFQHTFIVIIVAILSTLAYIFNNELSELLVYQRQFIEQGEYWRLFTGHFFHTNNNHLYLNLAALIMLWALHGHFYTVTHYLLLFSIAAFTTSVGIYFFSSDITQYVGLSGVLHGVFIWGAIMDIQAKEKTGYILFIGVWLKIAHEQLYGASNDVIELIGANVATDAHLWGAVGGMLYALLYILYARYNNISHNSL